VLRGDHLAQAPPGSPLGPLAGAGVPPGGVVLPADLTLDEASRRYMQATVDACDGNRTEAARRLGVGRNTITRKLGSG